MTDPVNAEQAEGSDAPVFDPEDVSDAGLRAWARDNGIEGVPAGGRLSSAWRDSITNAMAAALALDPKAEASAESTSSESTGTTSTKTSNATETTTEEKTQNPETDFLTDGPATASTEPVRASATYDPATGRSVWQPPNTFVTSQHYTQH